MKSKTKEQVAVERDHLTMMQHPEWWENEWLALRRGPAADLEKIDEIGRQVDSGELPLHEFFEMELPKIDYGFLLPGFGPLVFIGLVTEQSKRHIKYANFEAVLADGWQVD